MHWLVRVLPAALFLCLFAINSYGQDLGQLRITALVGPPMSDDHEQVTLSLRGEFGLTDSEVPEDPEWVRFRVQALQNHTNRAENLYEHGISMIVGTVTWRLPPAEPVRHRAWLGVALSFGVMGLEKRYVGQPTEPAPYDFYYHHHDIEDSFPIYRIGLQLELPIVRSFTLTLEGYFGSIGEAIGPFLETRIDVHVLRQLDLVLEGQTFLPFPETVDYDGGSTRFYRSDFDYVFVFVGLTWCFR